jgi:hypothetical protein
MRRRAWWAQDPCLAYTTGCSNGPTKGREPAHRKVKRVGRGFRNFANNRLWLLLHCAVRWQTHRTARLRGPLPTLGGVEPVWRKSVRASGEPSRTVAIPQRSLALQSSRSHWRDGSMTPPSPRERPGTDVRQLQTMAPGLVGQTIQRLRHVQWPSGHGCAWTGMRCAFTIGRMPVCGRCGEDNPERARFCLPLPPPGGPACRQT